MEIVRCLNITRRLAAGFGLVLCLLIVMLVVALYYNKKQSNEFNKISAVTMVEMRQYNILLDINNEIIRIQRDMILKRGSDVANDELELDRQHKKYDHIWSEQLKTPTSANGQRIREDVIKKYEAVKGIDQRILNLVKDGNIEQAAIDAVRIATPAMLDLNKVLTEGLTYQEKRSDAGFNAILQSSQQSSMALVLIGSVSLLLGGFASWVVARSLIRPLSLALQVASNVAAGRLDDLPIFTGSDEPAQLLRSLSAMQDQIKSVVLAQVNMARIHDEGRFSYRIDEKLFNGEYARLVHEINSLVDSHVNAALGLVAFMQRYAIGDLTEDFPRFPGEKALAHEAMDEVKANIGGIGAEIKRLSLAAANGDFSIRGDATKFKFEFQEMVENLNAMMAISDSNLSSLSAVLGAISAGDLDQQMHGDFNGVFAQMRDGANTTTQQLSNIIARIHHSVDAIHTAASEISTGNNDLSRRTEIQAANLEETAAAMEEMTSTVRQNAEHARQASSTSQQANQAVQDTAQAISEVVDVMQQISASSSRINEIITVIDGIAFQTNILALNAAVEAARAGDQGRGFTVVATEVRTLAQRSATAAKEIKDLIVESGRQVESGIACTQKTQKYMASLIEFANDVVGRIDEISMASREQSAGIEQINNTITQLDETTQQNAALVEEANAAARSLEEQVLQLNHAVSVFHLRHDTASARSLA